MASPRPLYCYTCKSDDAHRPLNSAEKSWLRQRIGRTYVEDFFMCTAPGCRNLRTGLNKRPFDNDIRVPPPPG